jgi:hypothetical protein
MRDRRNSPPAGGGFGAGWVLESAHRRAGRGGAGRVATSDVALHGHERATGHAALRPRMLVRRAPQEAHLVAVAAAPFAQEQMRAQTKPLQRGQWVIERLRLQPAGVPAIGASARRPDLRAGSRLFKKCILLRQKDRCSSTGRWRDAQAYLPLQGLPPAGEQGRANEARGCSELGAPPRRTKRRA